MRDEKFRILEKKPSKTVIARAFLPAPFYGPGRKAAQDIIFHHYSIHLWSRRAADSWTPGLSLHKRWTRIEHTRHRKVFTQCLYL